MEIGNLIPLDERWPEMQAAYVGVAIYNCVYTCRHMDIPPIGTFEMNVLRDLWGNEALRWVFTPDE